MDRITKSLLDEFSRENEITNLAEDKQFEHFMAYLAISRHFGDAFDTTDTITGAGADTGIDGIGIIVNGALVTDPELITELAETNGYLDVTFVFIQAERSSSFDTAKIGQFGFGTSDFFSEKPKLPRNEKISILAEIVTVIFNLSSRFKRGNPICKLYYMTTGKWTGDSNLEARRQAVVEDLLNLGIFSAVDFAAIDASGIQRLYNQTKNAISREFTFAERTVLPDMPGVSEAYLGIIPAKEFLKLIEDESGEIIRSIFYDNVRDWQNFNTVNTGIRDTLLRVDSRTRFVLMNNGITVIAKTLRPTGNKLYIEDYQVVNGCQTSHVLWYQREQLDDSIFVPLRLIATQDENVISDIIKATNRQTEVTEEQLLALSDFQKKLELFFQAFEHSKRLYYERRSRQYNNVANVEKTRIVTPANLIRAYASMFLDEPHRTTRNFKSLLERVGKTIFGVDHRLDPYYIAAFSHYRLEYLFRSQTLDAKYKPARYHILMAFRYLLKSEGVPRPNSHEIERYCTSINEIVWNQLKAEEFFKQAAEVVDNVAKGNFHRDHIRTQPFTEELKGQFQ